ncbi:hypothetical protein OSB04_un000979 [Centaurea solstitialis]|uniref:Uncharacterized protein n=1 Tax=Centaurea solstitialis TaxID=347529 RepID=A0AA38W243_9ASTR|nr:hypothetical protein OSB04_un000979 [Centaurea solstitialis]
MINKFSHLKFKEANTPYDNSCKLNKNVGRAVAQLEYASARIFTSNPSLEHWEAIGRVFGYLKRTKNFALHYGNFPAVLEGFSDASWITSDNDNKSTSGLIFMLGGGAVSWASMKQMCITHSTMEAEFLALAASGKEANEAKWGRNMLFKDECGPETEPNRTETDRTETENLSVRSGEKPKPIGQKPIWTETDKSEFRKLKTEPKIIYGVGSVRFRSGSVFSVQMLTPNIKLWPQPMPAISLHCDSEATLSRAYNKIYNGKSRHIRLRHAYIRELITNRIITIIYVRSCNNLSAPFTKGLPGDVIFGTTREMGLRPTD